MRILSKLFNVSFLTCDFGLQKSKKSESEQETLYDSGLTTKTKRNKRKNKREKKKEKPKRRL